MTADRFEVDCVVIGAGVVGLAIAAELSRRGRQVIIVERNGAFGEETSARNSEVIHAGLYYPEGSLKAALCPRGRDLLYEWCAARGVAHRRTGKLIVAAEAGDQARLERIQKRATIAGVALEHLTAPEMRRLEPALSGVAALRSPLTGIIDSHGFMSSLLAATEERGGQLALRAPVCGGEIRPDGVALRLAGAEPAILLARLVINAAGLWAPKLGARIEGAPPPPATRFTKGCYFSLSGRRSPFSRLIYPAPVPGGLGVHLTVDLAGAARFGPDVAFLEQTDPDALDYQVAEERAEAFYMAIRRYWPELPDGALKPDYAGVRPQLRIARDTPSMISDFVIRPDHDGALIQLFGIESPGLTASLAIAEHVAQLIAKTS